jgi:hypothetical protein
MSLPNGTNPAQLFNLTYEWRLFLTRFAHARQQPFQQQDVHTIWTNIINHEERQNEAATAPNEEMRDQIDDTRSMLQEGTGYLDIA